LQAQRLFHQEQDYAAFCHEAAAEEAESNEHGYGIYGSQDLAQAQAQAQALAQALARNEFDAAPAPAVACSKPSMFRAEQSLQHQPFAGCFDACDVVPMSQ
jgi:hypothetical protein